MDIDLETARRAKIDAVFVKGGSSKLSDVKKYKEKIVINSLKELYER
jgi:phosphoglycolate phosphatase-like HAD superfamily hydrolase